MMGEGQLASRGPFLLTLLYTVALRCCTFSLSSSPWKPLCGGMWLKGTSTVLLRLGTTTSMS